MNPKIRVTLAIVAFFSLFLAIVQNMRMAGFFYEEPIRGLFGALAPIILTALAIKILSIAVKD